MHPLPRGALLENLALLSVGIVGAEFIHDVVGAPLALVVTSKTTTPKENHAIQHRRSIMLHTSNTLWEPSTPK